MLSCHTRKGRIRSAERVQAQPRPVAISEMPFARIMRTPGSWKDFAHAASRSSRPALSSRSGQEPRAVRRRPHSRRSTISNRPTIRLPKVTNKYDFENRRIGAITIDESLVFDPGAALVSQKQLEARLDPLERKADNLRDDVQELAKLVRIIHQLKTRVAASDAVAVQAIGAVAALGDAIGLDVNFDQDGRLTWRHGSARSAKRNDVAVAPSRVIGGRRRRAPAESRRRISPLRRDLRRTRRAGTSRSSPAHVQRVSLPGARFTSERCRVRCREVLHGRSVRSKRVHRGCRTSLRRYGSGTSRLRSPILPAGTRDVDVALHERVWEG